MKVQSVAAFGPIAADIGKSRDLYVKTLGLPLKEEANHYLHGAIAGAEQFAVFPLPAAAQACFGTDTWPKDVPVPSSWIAFDVDDTEAATKELSAAGYKLLVSAQKSPWGPQVVTWFLSPEGVLTKVANP